MLEEGEKEHVNLEAAPEDPEAMGLRSPQTRELLSVRSWIYVNIAVIVVSFLLLNYYLPRRGCFVEPDYNASALVLPRTGTHGEVFHDIVVVTDLDHDSKNGNHWQSYLKRGVLKINTRENKASVTWDYRPDIVLIGDMAAKGRAMELSDLVVFNGQLLSVDDRTGIIYRIVEDKIIPWVFLNDGPGNTTKGFKAEWMTVKDNRLIIGGLGKEWTTGAGEFVNDYPMWIKIVSHIGQVEHVDWYDNYKAVRAVLGIDFPGYMIHESAQWSEYHKQWFFLPRRISHEAYDENKDEYQGANLLFQASDTFKTVKYQPVGQKGDGTRGFSAFQFIPNTKDDIIVALKSEEIDGKPVGSYILVFRVSDGALLMQETALDGAHKFEGIAFA